MRNTQAGFFHSLIRCRSTVQDALASYLYLIRPPPGAKHKAVDPAKLTVAGDSAGGGLSLALMCLIRDSGLPPPAGCELLPAFVVQYSRLLTLISPAGLLISPWCDLSHSFPSILQNTKSDVIRECLTLPHIRLRADANRSLSTLRFLVQTFYSLATTS